VKTIIKKDNIIIGFLDSTSEQLIEEFLAMGYEVEEYDFCPHCQGTGKKGAKSKYKVQGGRKALS
jgi:hypothetical protein